MPLSFFRVLRSAFALALVTAIAASPARAQDAGFFAGKTVSVVIPYSSGGLYGTFGQLLVKHLGGHVPGKPTVIPQFMPGAGGVKALNHVYAVAPKDGTTLITPAAGVVTLPLLRPGSVRYDPAKFNYLGAWGTAVYTVSVFHTAPVKTLKEATKTEVVIGTTGRSSVNYQLPYMLNHLLGTKFRLITGYGGGSQVRLAMERGEAHGFAGNFLGWKSTRPQWLKEGKLIHLVQFGMQRSPDLPDVPLLTEFAENERQRNVFNFIADTGLVAFALVTPPAVPEPRLGVLADAYMATLADPDFRAGAEKLGFPIDPLSRKQVTEAVERITGVSQQTLETVREVMGYNR